MLATYERLDVFDDSEFVEKEVPDEKPDIDTIMGIIKADYTKFPDFVLSWTSDDSLEIPHPGNHDYEVDVFLFDRSFIWEKDGPPPVPYPRSLRYTRPTPADQERFVIMPLSAGTAKVGKRLRHELVHEALASMSRGVRDLDHVYQCMHSYRPNWLPSETLPKLMEEIPDLLKLLSKIALLALRSRELITQKIRLLDSAGKPNRIKNRRSLHMSQEQAASLLALAFFCCFQGNAGKRINFFPLHRLSTEGGLSMVKMRFMLSYFREVTGCMPNGTLSFVRRRINQRECTWKYEDKKFMPLYATHTGLIEEMTQCLQVDFANKYIGGGVLDRGCVQEEIRFLCCPEMIVSMLFCPVMDNDEAIFIYGAEQYSDCDGYGRRMQWSEYDGQRDVRDMYGRARSYLVAIDAMSYPDAAIRTQYREQNITRELNKALAGFSGLSADSPKRPVATGNWGCGAFNGDRELKSLLQLIACAKANRPMVYFTFGDKPFARALELIHKDLVELDVRNGVVAHWLQLYEARRGGVLSVFTYVREQIEKYRQDPSIVYRYASSRL